MYIDAVDGVICTVPSPRGLSSVECDEKNLVRVPISGATPARAIGMISKYDGWAVTDQLYRVRLSVPTPTPTLPAP